MIKNFRCFDQFKINTFARLHCLRIRLEEIRNVGGLVSAQSQVKDLCASGDSSGLFLIAPCSNFSPLCKILPPNYYTHFCSHHCTLALVAQLASIFGSVNVSPPFYGPFFLGVRMTVNVRPWRRGFVNLHPVEVACFSPRLTGPPTTLAPISKHKMT